MRHSASCIAGLLLLAGLIIAPTALATPVTLNFETGGTLNYPITNEYGPPGTPAGPTFETGTSAGFTGLNCGPPTLHDGDTAYSGSRTLALNGCPGGESRPSATFFALGYTTSSVEFLVAVQGSYSSCPGFICAEIWTTAFRADGTIIAQQQTLLPPQTGPTYKGVPLQSSNGDIAFVAIERGARDYLSGSPTGVTLAPGFGGPYLLVDDLTYDPPSSPPASSFRIGTDRTGVRVAQGQQAPLVKTPITWTNNPDPSSSPVSLELDAPAGITGTFSPPTTTSGTSTLTMQVAKTVEAKTYNVTIHGYVDKGTVSEKHAQTTLPVEVVAPYVVSAVGDYSEAPCSTREVAIHVATDQQFHDPVAVKVSLSQPGVSIASVTPGTVYSDYAIGTLTDQNRTMIVKFAVAPGAAPAAARDISVVAEASGYGPQSRTGTFTVNGGDITDVFLGGTTIPVASVVPKLIPGGFLRQPTKLDLRGHGFCPGSLVEFGATGGGVTPSSISADGTALSVTVPRTAIDGPLRVSPGGGGAPITAAQPLSVSNFRARWSLRFANYGAPNNLTYKQFEQVFGYAAMHVTVDVCAGLTLGLAHCPVVTPIPDPVAVIIKVALEGRAKLGQCYGFSRTVGQFAFGAPFASFPPGNATTPNGLDPPGGVYVPGTLLDLIQINHIHQWDQNVLISWGQTVGGNYDKTPAQRGALMRQRIIDQLTARPNAADGGQPPIVAMQADGGGHAVLAYDLEDLGGGRFKIDVLDPNVPFTPAEPASGTHAAMQDGSAIVVDPGADKWTFANLKQKDGNPWSGSLDGKSLWVQPLGVTYDAEPKLPGLGALPYLITLATDGSALGQITDERGRRLIDSTGATQTGKNGIPGAVALPPTDAAEGANPIGLLPPGGDYTVTAPRAASGGRLTVIGTRFAATATTGANPGAAQAVAAKAAATDKLAVDGKTHEVALTPGANGPIGVTLAARAAGGATQTVALSGTAKSGGSDRVGLGRDGDVTIAHFGPKAARTLTLQSTSASGSPVVATLRGLRLNGGERLRLHVDWRHLGGSIAAVRRLGAHPRRVRLAARRARTSLLKPVRLSSTSRRDVPTVIARLARRGSARWVTAGVSLAIVRGKRVVARKTVALSQSQLNRRAATLRWTGPRLRAGSYRVVALASASTIGRDGVARSDARRATATLRVGS